MLWNSVPLSIKESTSLPIFKNRLKRFLFKQTGLWMLILHDIIVLWMTLVSAFEQHNNWCDMCMHIYMHMYVYMYIKHISVCMYTCMYTYTYIHMYEHIHAYTHFTHTHIYTCTYIYMYIHVHIYEFMHIHIHVHMYIRTHTYPSTRTKNVSGYALSFWILRRNRVFSGAFHGLCGPWNCRKREKVGILLTTTLKTSNKGSYPRSSLKF